MSNVDDWKKFPQILRADSFLSLGWGSTLHTWTIKPGFFIIIVEITSKLSCHQFKWFSPPNRSNLETKKELSSVAVRWQTRRQVKTNFFLWRGLFLFAKCASAFDKDFFSLDLHLMKTFSCQMYFQHLTKTLSPVEMWIVSLMKTLSSGKMQLSAQQTPQVAECACGLRLALGVPTKVLLLNFYNYHYI